MLAQEKGDASLLVLVIFLLGLPLVQVPGIPFQVPAAMLVALSVLALRIPSRDVRIPGAIGGLFLLFLLAQSVSLVWGDVMDKSAIAHLQVVNTKDIHLSQFRFIWQMGAWILGFGVFLFAFNNLRSLNDIGKLTKAFILVGIIVASYGYYEFMARNLGLPYIYPSIEDFTYRPVATISFGDFHFPRIYSSFSEPKALGKFLLVPIFLSVSMWFVVRGVRSLIISAYLIGALILTFSTTAWLGLVVGFVIWIFLLSRILRRKVLRLLTPLALIFVSAWIMVALFLQGGASTNQAVLDLHFERVTRINDPTLVSNDYIIGWQLGWELFGASPLFGIGIGNSPLFSGVEDRLFTPFSLYLLLLAETGLLGFAAFCLLILIPSFRSLKAIGTKGNSAIMTSERAILIGALAAFAGGLVTYAAFGGARLFLEDWIVLALLAKGAVLVRRLSVIAASPS